MSLLMDALKKAEQEKKEAGKRLRKAREKGTEELKLTDKEEPGKKPGKDSPPPPESIPADVSEISGENLTLTPKEKDDDTLELPQMGDNSGVDYAQVTGEHEVTEFSEEDAEEELEDSGSNKIIDEPLPEESSLTPETVEEELPEQTAPEKDKTFALASDDTEEERVSPEIESTKQEEQIPRMDISDKQRLSRSIISAAELAHDIGGGRGKPTPVAAQTVFTAVAGKQGQNQLYRWGIFTFLCMVIAVAIGVFYYLSISPMTPTLTPQQVATSTELNPVVTMDIDRIREAASQPEATGKVSRGSLTGEAVTGEEDAIATVVQKPDTAETPSPGLQAGDQPAETDTETSTVKPEAEEAEVVADTKTGTGAGVPAEPQPPVETVEDVKTLPEKIRVQPTAIKISRSKAIDEESKLISSAYADYTAGRYQAAGMKYRAAVSEMPENPDALLGLAATEYRQGNPRAAYENYLRVLKLYPDNKNAKAALISLQDTQNVAEHASTVKLLIQQEPHTPYLYFSLGNLYAGQSRWPEAQQAFFDAFRLDSDNPDYAFNLAVSLDQIGQRKAALDYYRTALQLADNTPATFDSAGVLARVNTLAGIVKTSGQ